MVKVKWGKRLTEKFLASSEEPFLTQPSSGMGGARTGYFPIMSRFLRASPIKHVTPSLHSTYFGHGLKHSVPPGSVDWLKARQVISFTTPEHPTNWRRNHP